MSKTDAAIERLLDGKAEVSDIISTVKSALNDVVLLPDEGAELKSVDLELNTVVSGEAGVDIKIVIIDVELSAMVSAEQVQTIQLTIKPPTKEEAQKAKEEARKNGQMVTPPNLEGDLAESIKVIYEGISTAAQSPFPFVLDCAYAELKFTVSAEGKISVIWFGAQVNATSIQTVRLTFGPKGS